jgi:excinuclease ABC subunit A
MPDTFAQTALEVRKARTHNLKGIDCRVPHGRVTVVTGPSGAGKSSLAFDTVYAEGQRRFVESMSTYARQFLDQMERPPVDEIRNVLPPVAIEAHNSVKNARSTVGTITEVYDVLRLLFTHLGEVQCPRGHGGAVSFTPDRAAELLAAGEAGERFTLAVRIRRPKRGASVALRELIRQGYARRLDGDEVVRMTSKEVWRKEQDPLELALGRFSSASGSTLRLAAAIEEGYRLGRGMVEARGESATIYFGERLSCRVCGERFHQPVPALFSFNSPLGACNECQGFGRVIGVDRLRVVPDPSLSLLERPIAPWNSPAYEDRYDELLPAAREAGVRVDVPWAELTDEERAWVWDGDGDHESIGRFFGWLERRSYKVHYRTLLARYRAYDPCQTCGGSRLQRAALAVLVEGATLPSLCAMSIEAFRRWLAERRWTLRQREVAGHLLEELTERIEVLHRVGLDYLTLDRQARTLSGGETQRIHLAAALGSGLTSTLYVLDEPTIGLHPRDSDRLVSLLRDLASRGNTVLVVEHDRTLIRGADHIIDLGPAAGEHGGRVVAEGDLEEILASATSVTGAYLQERPPTNARLHSARHRREQGQETLEEEIEAKPRIRVRGARAHNLTGFDVELPLASMVAVTGVSGSGKSTLVENVIYAWHQRAKGVVDFDLGESDGIEGLDQVSDVVLVDQRPLGRSSRSNAATYTKAYDDIRKLYASTPEAKRRKISAGHFSFNLDRGRCAECQGTGEVEVDMQFMASVTVTCDACQGKRFVREVLAVRYQGLDISETLEMTVDSALHHFAEHKPLCRKLRSLADVGLGYLRLGQATSTLSGGEAQRLKLASFLDERGKSEPRLFLFDEPTTGLHMGDIDLLYRTLRQLVQRGHGVVVVEHSLDLIARADWVVDLGPGGGVHGGELMYSGPLVPFVEQRQSPTAEELRQLLKWEPLDEAMPA